MGRGFLKGSKDLESPCLHVATETLICYRMWTGHPLGLLPKAKKSYFSFTICHTLWSKPLSTYTCTYLDSIGLTSIMINCYPKFQLFPSPPMVAYQRYRNLKEEFVHSKFWKLYHRHIYHLLGKHLHLSGSIHGIVWGRYQEGFHLLYYTCIYIYIYIYFPVPWQRGSTLHVYPLWNIWTIIYQVFLHIHVIFGSVSSFLD